MSHHFWYMLLVMDWLRIPLSRYPKQGTSSQTFGIPNRTTIFRHFWFGGRPQRLCTRVLHSTCFKRFVSVKPGRILFVYMQKSKSGFDWSQWMMVLLLHQSPVVRNFSKGFKEKTSDISTRYCCWTASRKLGLEWWVRDSQIIQQTIVSLSICWRGAWRLGGRASGQNNMVGATATRVDGWMNGWMDGWHVLFAIVDAMIGVCYTRVLRLELWGLRKQRA